MPRPRADNARRAFVAVGTSALVAVAPERALAEVDERPLDLEWTAPEGCPTGDEVVARVGELVGRSAPAPRRKLFARGRLTVTATTAGARYQLELVIARSEVHTRTVSGDDCSHVVDAAAVILALNIDPGALSRRQGEAGPPPTGDHASVDAHGGVAAPSSSLEGAPSLPPPPAVAPATSDDRNELQLRGGARIVFDAGSLPRTTLGGGGVIAVARGPLVLEVQGTVYKDQFTVSGPREGRGGAHVALSTLSGHACWRALGSHLELRGCIGGDVGIESTTGAGVARSETASGLWSSASMMLGVRALPRGTVSPAGGIAIVHPIAAPPVFIEGFGTIFEAPAVVVRSFLGLDVTFF